jgi:hypothetical protein
MKLFGLPFGVLLTLLGAAFSSFAQTNVTSINVVGYINLTLYPGDNLIANQLNFYATGRTNRINDILHNVPSGSTYTMWDFSTQSYLPVSAFDGTTWSINYQLELSQGALVHCPTLATNTFVGDVVAYSNLIPEFGGPVWQPNYADGLHLLSSPVPVAASMSTLFYFVTGRSARQGENVTLLDPATQSYLTTTYDSLTGWDNGDPTLAVGRAAWFNLGPVNVPEPGVFSLLVLPGAVWLRRKTRV